jgi:hypothetical protein
MIKSTFMREGSIYRQDTITLENSYYDAIYDVIAGDESHEKKAVILNKLKAKIIRLNNHNNKRILVDNHGREVMEGEDPSIFHIIRMMKRKDTRTITSTQDQNGITHTTPEGIMRNFITYLKDKYTTIQTDGEGFEKLLSSTQHTISETANDTLDSPITIEELHRAIKKGKTKKASGPDGTSQDFFKEVWEVIHPDILEIMQEMHTTNAITKAQTHGMMVCIPKKNRFLQDQKTTEYRLY